MELVNESPRVLGNRYEVGDLLGRGGMAEVHLGRDTRLGRTVAIKLLRTDLARDPIFQARFRREAQSAAALNHPAIVAVYDTGEESATDQHTGTVTALPYIVMEFVEGRTLRDLLDGRSLEVGQALEVTAGVLSALEYSHRSGIVHRDIKPGNVMVTPVGDVKVMDFGIARALADSAATMTQTQAVIGTAQYLSPEQARGETVDARSDLYSAGCLLFELLTGRPPFVADSPVAVAYQHVRESPRPPSTYNSAVPETVDRIVLHSLAKDREARYQSAAEFRADVEAARAGRRVSVMASPAAPTGVDPNAATEFLPSAQAAAGTRAMPPAAGGYYQQGAGAPRGAGPTAGYGAAGPGGGSMLPGAPDPGTDYEYDYGYSGHRDQRQQDRNGSKTAGYAMLAVGVLAVFALVAFIVVQVLGSRPDTGTAGKVTVPMVQGKTVTEAEQALKDKGLRWDVVRQPSEETPQDRVISQDPTSGSPASQGDTVKLTVSSGSSKLTVPDVTGKPLDQAQQELKDQGFTPGSVQRKDDPNVKKDDVISTDPQAGTSAARGDTVNLVVSTGNVYVPDETGQTLADARSALKKLGLDVQVNPQEQPSDKPAGTVIFQDYKNVSVQQGSTVTLTVSSGPTQTTQPTTPTTPTDSPPTSPTGSPTPSASATIP
jgi:beta-lactam-binding protein with PASTA domain/predicted Ser/Thr protein kinase